jgi:hypothetical protein
MVRHEPRCLTKWRHPNYVWSSDVGISDSEAVRDAARQINQANQIVGIESLTHPRICEAVTDLCNRIALGHFSINDIQNEILDEIREGHLSCWQARHLYNKIVEHKAQGLANMRDEIIARGATEDFANLNYSDEVFFHREMDDDYLSNIYGLCWCNPVNKAVS